jgi:hypothetical protein
MKDFLNWELNNQMYSLDYNGDTLMFIDDGEDIINDDSSVLIGANPAILFSAAFRWFREKYKLRNTITDFIDDETGIEWDYEIAIIGTDLDEKGNYKPLVAYSTDDETRKFKTYEEAELACLTKLIEIVKSKKL